MMKMILRKAIIRRKVVKKVRESLNMRKMKKISGRKRKNKLQRVLFPPS